MTPDELETRGRLLYGRQWQSALARNLKVHRVTIFRWMAGTKIPPWEEERIEVLLETRTRLLQSMLVNIARQKAYKCSDYAA